MTNYEPRLDREALFEHAYDLGLHHRRHAIVGAGVMCALGMEGRETVSDLDGVLPPSEIDKIEREDGWEWGYHDATDTPCWRRWPYDLSTRWHNGANKPEDLEQLGDLIVIEGIHFIAPQKLLAWKLTQLSQPGTHERDEKDRRDVEILLNHGYRLE